MKGIKDRKGERKVLKNGHTVIIERYDSASKCLFRFDDGTEVIGTYHQFETGGLTNPSDIGKKHKDEKLVMHDGWEATLIRWDDIGHVLLRFSDGKEGLSSYYSFKSKSVKKQTAIDMLKKYKKIKNKGTKAPGEQSLMSNGQIAEIIAFRKAGDIDIKFEDKTVVSTTYQKFKYGMVQNPKFKARYFDKLKEEREREEKVMTDGNLCKCIEYNSANDCLFRFPETGYEIRTYYCAFQRGHIKDKLAMEKKRKGVPTKEQKAQQKKIIRELKEEARDIIHKKIEGTEWTVLRRADKDKLCQGRPIPTYRCRCSCGQERDVIVTNLLSGKSKSCGCKRINKLKSGGVKYGRKQTDVDAMIGQVYGNLRVIEEVEPYISPSGFKQRKVKCVCTKCGKEVIATTSAVLHGRAHVCRVGSRKRNKQK